MGYQIKCNFKEKLIELDVARYLGGFTPLLESLYYLEDADEKLTGADLISEDANAIPIYIQAKVSQGLRTVNKVKVSGRKNRSPLEDIRQYRHDLSLDMNDDYFLYFQLRKKAENASDFQHNVLMRYANSGFSHAFYVAPLIIEKTEYENQFLNFRNLPFDPFYFHHYELIGKRWSSIFGFIPFLRNHISIVPHERVDTHEHYYAYSQHGTDITWHSPAFISESPARLSDRMVRIFRDFLASEKRETIATLAGKLADMPLMDRRQYADMKPVDIIAKHGALIEQTYGIKQLLFVQSAKV